MIRKGKETALAAIIGGVLGIYLTVVMFGWQFCWLGAIIGGLAWGMSYAPEIMLSWAKKLFDRIGNSIYYFLFFYEGTIPITVTMLTFVGWTFIAYIWISPERWVGAASLTFILSFFYFAFLVALCIFLEQFINKRLANSIGYYVFAIWFIIGLIGLILFNPLLAAYTVPLAVKMALILALIVMAIGIILAVLFLGAVVGMIIMVFLLVCYCLVDLLIRIIKTIFSDDWLLIGFLVSVGIIFGHLLTKDFFGGFLGGIFGTSIGCTIVACREYIKGKNNF